MSTLYRKREMCRFSSGVWAHHFGEIKSYDMAEINVIQWVNVSPKEAPHLTLAIRPEEIEDKWSEYCIVSPQHIPANYPNGFRIEA